MTDLRHLARMFLEREDASLLDLWISYWNLGGRCHPFEFDAYIYDVLLVDRFDTEALAFALQEMSLEVAA
jgi:hypothetical protein